MIRGEMILMILPLLLLLSHSLQRLQKNSLTLLSVHRALHNVLPVLLDVLHLRLRPLGRLFMTNSPLMVDTNPIPLSLGGSSQLVRRVFKALSTTMTCSVEISSHNVFESILRPLLRRLSPQIMQTRPSATVLPQILSLLLQSTLLLSLLFLCLHHLV